MVKQDDNVSSVESRKWPEIVLAVALANAAKVARFDVQLITGHHTSAIRLALREQQTHPQD